MKKDRQWVDVNEKLPRTAKEVEIQREDGTIEMGYKYNSNITGVTWIDSKSHKIKQNEVIAWREK